MIDGVGRDAVVVENDRGGRQSDSPYRADLLPPLALLAVAGVLKQGADKYGDHNWRRIPIEDHLNHAFVHLLAHLAGDTQDDHLGHYACRALMALELRRQQQQTTGADRPHSEPTKKRVYIAGPITKGDLLSNIQQADEAFRSLQAAGFAPLCPHWSAYAGSARRTTTGSVCATADTAPWGTNHDDWMGVSLPWVAAADALLRLPGESRGADMETTLAASLGIPIFHAIDDLLAWAGRCDPCRVS